MNKREWSVVSGQWSAATLVSCFSLLALLFLSACAPGRQEIRPSKPIPAAADIIRNLEDIRGKVFSLKGMARIKVVYNEKESNVKEVLVVKRASKIRAETLSPFGTPVFTIVLDGPDVSIYKPSDNIYYKGNIKKHEIPLPFPVNELGSEELANILLGSISVIKYGNSSINSSELEKAYILTLRSQDGFKRQEITVDAGDLSLRKTEIIDGERGMVLSVTFGNYQEIGNLFFPKEIDIRFANRPDNLRIRYEDIDLNSEVADDLFVLTPP